MKTTRLLSLVATSSMLLFAFVFPAAAQSPSPAASASVSADQTPVAQAAPDAAELTKLLKDFLDGASRNDIATHERFWADDLIYTASAGRRMGKADILREVRSEPHPKAGEEETVYTAEDIRVQQYGTTAVVAFRLVGTNKDGTKNNYLNSGTFLKRDGKWQVVNWQATKLAGETDAKK